LTPYDEIYLKDGRFKLERINQQKYPYCYIRALPRFAMGLLVKASSFGSALLPWAKGRKGFGKTPLENKPPRKSYNATTSSSTQKLSATKCC
jgi:hypothetical protein